MKKNRGCLLILTVLLTFLTELSLPSLAEAETVELLSYSELMALPLEKRIEYVDGVREILMDLSKDKDGRFSDSQPDARSRLEAWLNTLDSMLSEAQAQANVRSCASNPECREAFNRCFSSSDRLVEWAVGGANGLGSYKCGEKANLKADTSISINNIMWRIPDPQFATKLQQQLSLQRLRNPQTKNTSSANALHSANVSPSSQNLLRDLTKKKTNSALFESLIDARIDTMAKFIEHTNADVRMKCYSKHRNKSVGPELVKCTDDQEVELAQAFEKSRSFASTGSGASSVPETGDLPSSAAVPIPIVLGGSSGGLGGPVGSLSGSASGLGGPAGHAMQVAPLPEIKDPPPPAPPSPSSKPATLKADLKSKHSCAPTPETCEAPSKTRAQVFQGGLPCVFAGMVSHLDSKNRRCQAVMSFKVGEQNFSCARGQTMCNPLLFGTVNATTPICIGRGQSATVLCSKLSAPRDAERFLNRNISGLQDNWNDFREKFKSVCEPETIQAKFHCVECNVMRLRLFELHARILSDPCRSRTSGEDAVDARIRIRSAPTTK